MIILINKLKYILINSIQITKVFVTCSDVLSAMEIASLISDCSSIRPPAITDADVSC